MRRAEIELWAFPARVDARGTVHDGWTMSQLIRVYKRRDPVHQLVFVYFSDDCWNIPCYLPERILITPTGRDLAAYLLVLVMKLRRSPRSAHSYIYQLTSRPRFKKDPSLDASPNSNSPGDFTVWRTPQKLNATFLKIYSEKCIIIYTQNRKNFIRPRNPIYSLPVNTLHYQVNHNINCWSFYYCPSLYPLDWRPDRQVAGRKEVPLKRLLVTLLHHSTYL